MVRAGLGRVGFALVVCCAAAACGDAGLLDGVGQRSQRLVLGDELVTSTLVSVEVAVVPGKVKSLSDVNWWNDAIEGEANEEVLESGGVAAHVWRRNGSEAAQASRLEIAAALPDIGFPSRVPEQVMFITSQLVYDVASGTLDAARSAQFGFWPEVPYNVSDGSLAKLYVGLVGEFPIDGIARDVVDAGLSLSWTEGAYRYELFCRTGTTEDLCRQMVESTTRLSP